MCWNKGGGEKGALLKDRGNHNNIPPSDCHFQQLKPSHLCLQMVSRIQKVRASVAAQRGGDPPGDAEVAATLGISLEKVQLYSQAGRPAGSLEDPMDSHARPDSGPEGGVLGDVLEDPRPTAYDQVMQVSCLVLPSGG